MPQPFWRHWFGLRELGRAARLALILVIEFVLIAVLVFVIGTFVIPLAAPGVDPPTATPVTRS